MLSSFCGHQYPKYDKKNETGNKKGVELKKRKKGRAQVLGLNKSIEGVEFVWILLIVEN